MAPEQGPDRKEQTQEHGKMKEYYYRLIKSHLVNELQMLGLNTEGSIDDLRRRLDKFIDENPEMFEATAAPVPRPPTLTIPSEIPASPMTIIPANAPSNTSTQIMNQMRKWGLHFEGKDPWAFLERIDELRAAYEFSDAHWLRGLPELLRGDALLWCRNNRDNWNSWAEFIADFKDTFLPRRYRLQLINEISDRVQKEGEPYIKYATQMLARMWRAEGYSTEEQFEQRYENLHPDYQNRIWRSDVRSPRDLQQRAGEFEQNRTKRTTAKTAAADPPVTAAVYNRGECCWRCKQRGHTRFDCRRPAWKFCSRCGKDGVLTKDCHPPPGNETGTVETPAGWPVLSVKFTPRPHLETSICDRPLDALLDTGSEISFINEHTAQLAQTLGFPVTPEEEEVQLDNGQHITLPDRVRLPIRTAGRTIWHAFLIVPNLKSALLLGVDFWAKLGHAIPAPKTPNSRDRTPATTTTEGIVPRTPAEEERLREFLAEELPRFDRVTGPTNKTAHQICVKENVRRKASTGPATKTPAPPPISANSPPTPASQPPVNTQPLRAVGPELPPPIPVMVEPGHVLLVPYFHAHVSRQHKMRSRGKRWHIRFNRMGTVRTIREIKKQT
ncbi:uncharacterized protein [Temnothorax nylanderi]|uniref:uncharacterized protein n=1 Tax=Temnothorax nylanderi TaxID=102681 RepID=UPI003A89E96E